MQFILSIINLRRRTQLRNISSLVNLEKPAYNGLEFRKLENKNGPAQDQRRNYNV